MGIRREREMEGERKMGREEREKGWEEKWAGMRRRWKKNKRGIEKKKGGWEGKIATKVKEGRREQIFFFYQPYR